MTDDTSGPHLSAALICERVLNEQDGVASIVRIIDRVMFVVDEGGEPVDKQYVFFMYLSFKSGAARGAHDIEIRMEKPSGLTGPSIKASALFEGEERGVNIVMQSALEPDEQGLYWFDVLLNGERVTRIPLRVIYQKLPTATGGV